MSDTDKPVDTTVDPTEFSRGSDADTGQNQEERGEAIREFDDHMDGSGDSPSLPTPDDVAENPEVNGKPKDPKTTTRTE